MIGEEIILAEDIINLLEHLRVLPFFIKLMKIAKTVNFSKLYL